MITATTVAADFDFSSRMTELAGALERSPAEALRLAEALEHDLLAGPTTDPVEFGWARDYRIRALYRLGRHAEGVSVLTTPPQRVLTMSAKNAAWVHSVGAEMALRSGAIGQVRPLITLALSLRLDSGEPEQCAMAVSTGFALLRASGRWDEVDAWLSHVEAKLATVTDHAVAEALGDALAVATWGAWFPGELPSAERRRGELALHRAAADGLIDEVRRRLAEGVRVDARNPGRPGLPTPLIAAAFGGHAAVVELLLRHGADIRQTNVQGRTALHLAADQDRSLVVALLCTAGAQVDARDFHQHTPLHVAAWQDHRDSVRVLLGAGADLSARDVNGDTPLALAASEPVPEVVRALILAGAAVDAINDHGQTPLGRAAEEGQAGCVTALLEAGADATRRDGHGRTPHELAQAGGHREVARMLKKAAPARQARRATSRS